MKTDACSYGRCCVTEDVHPFAEGPRCGAHTPAALAGKPEPSSARYCPPKVCYCGRCGKPKIAAPTANTVIDLDRIRHGKNRASVEDLRGAQATPRRR